MHDVMHLNMHMHMHMHMYLSPGGYVNGVFNLALEGSEGDGFGGIGSCDMMDVHRLKHMLSPGDVKHVDLVFVNACFSYQAGRVFSRAGVPNV